MFLNCFFFILIVLAFVSENFLGGACEEMKALESDGGLPMTLFPGGGAPRREGFGEVEVCVEVEDDLEDIEKEDWEDFDFTAGAACVDFDTNLV